MKYSMLPIILLMGLGTSPLTAETPKPNIILIMADDLGWGDVSCFNPASPIRTPNLSAMAAAGMRLNRFYSAAPVCSPTRGSCITGRHPFRYGIYFANDGHLPTEELTLAELLQDRGYHTGHFGKWHLGTLTTKVQDANRGRPGNTNDYSPPWQNGFQVCFSTESKVPTWNPTVDPQTGANYGTQYWDENGDVVSDNLDGDDSRVIVDRVVPFIRTATRKQSPFFAVVWFHAPHLPVVAGPEYAALYPDANRIEKEYYGCVTAMDEQIGRLRAVLESENVAKNTMLWFCSDNGPEGPSSSPGSTAHFRGRKRSLYEGGVRVPGLLEWPSHVRGGSTSDFPAVTSDYYPTILAALDIKNSPERPMDGISLLPVLSGLMTTRAQPIGFQSAGQIAWITQRYKLYRKNDQANWELYDLLDDPAEANNLAYDYPEKVHELSVQLTTWRKACEQSDQGADY